MIYSFEQGLPEGVYSENSCILISSNHHKDGNHGLLWEMNGDALLILKGEVEYHHFKEGSLNQNRDNFIIWLYREEQQEEPLRISFFKEGRECCYFYFGQQFKGWRTCWVPYQDMEGNAEEGMDEIRLERRGCVPCRIWVDQLITSVPIDPRHPVPDKQVPFVNLSVNTSANAHWNSLLRFSRLEEEALGQEYSFEENADTDIALIEMRMQQFFLSHSNKATKSNHLMTDNECIEIFKKYEHFKIKQSADGMYTGVTIDYSCHKAAYPKESVRELSQLTKSIEVKECSQLLLDTAYAYHACNETQRKKLASCFVGLLQHLWEQGWAEGSSLGATWLLGYHMRSLYPAVFLMREPLKRAGILSETTDMIGWFSGRGRIFRKTEELRGESVDTLNTLLQGILCSILLMEDSKNKVCCLYALSRWLSTSLKPAPGLEGPFKVDGSSFHHANHYPAYAMGAFQGAAPVIYALSRTRFRLGEEAHRTMRKSLLYMRIYCNRYNWLVSMSSRHPKGIGVLSQISSLEPFYYMALAGDPMGQSEIDAEMAGALLRLAEYKDFPQAEELKKKGFEAEKSPEGHFTMNYACAGIHRRAEWMAGVRGQSRYLWGNETYKKNNLYGRYITYGNLQILGSGNPVNNMDSGFFQEGWDWNYFPGTTSVVLPWEELRQRVCVVDATAGFEEMLLSDEAFAGGVSFQGRQGCFGMKLHGHAKYDGTLRARKSWFFLNNKIICLGSDVEDRRDAYTTVTTLYQHYLKENMFTEFETDLGEQMEHVVTIRDLVIEEKLEIRDPSGNLYRIPAGQHVIVTRGLQESRAQDTDEPTWAYYEKAWLDHGKAPKRAEYEYMVTVQPQENELSATLEGMVNPTELPYYVIQKDKMLHAIYDVETGIYCYVFFEAGSVEQKECVVLKVDNACLLMVSRKENKLHLSFCDPDLRLYEGQEADQLNADGSQKEVSLYSRTWFRNKSVGKWTVITLIGQWFPAANAEDAQDVRVLAKEDTTEVMFWGQDGKTIELDLIVQEMISEGENYGFI